MRNKSQYLYGQTRFDKRYACHFMLVTFVVLLVISYLYALVGYKDDVEPFMENIRFFGTIEYFLLIFLSLTDIKIKQLLKILISILLIVILLVKMTYDYVDIDILGLTRDGYNYLKYGIKFSDKSYLDFIHSIYNQYFFLDDIGYFTLVYVFNRLYPDVNFVVYGIVILNLIFLYFSSVYFYKLSKLMGINDSASKLIVILWSASPFLMLVITDGLKEVIFTSIIILAVYNIYQFKKSRNLVNLFGALAFAILCLFFRTAVFYMLLVMFTVLLTMTEKNKRVYFITVVLLLALFQVIIPFVIEKIFGISFEMIIKAAMWRTETRTAGQASYAGYLPLLGAIVGPFPVLDRTAIYSIEFSQAVFVKDVFGLSFFLGVYDKIKRLDINYMPIIIYVIFNIFMLITAGVSLDMRYHMTYIPFFFLIAVPYLKKKYIYDWGYIAFVLVIIYFYGTRRLAKY